MRDFVGAGWDFPPSLSVSGGVALVTGLDEIEGALRSILSTAPGERLMRPDFGCAAWDYVFDPMNANTVSLVEQAVREAVKRWEPRVELLDVHATAVGSGFVVDLAYRVKATNDRRNLVHPFYVVAGEEPT